MEDEEDVDIMGNFDVFMTKSERDISKITSGQLLSCDYTVHPKWLNENAEGGNFWSDSVPKNEDIESNVEVLHSEEVVIEEPEPVPAIIALEWSAEGANHDDLIFEEDIPASIEEIVSQEEEIISDSPKSMSTEKIEEIESNIFEWEPAAFETHPPAKNVKYIGPTNSRSLLKVKIETSPPIRPNIRHPRSLLKTNNCEKPPTKFKQTLTIQPNALKINSDMTKQAILSRDKLNWKIMNPSKIGNNSRTKFKQTVKFTKYDLENEKIKIFTKKLKKKRTRINSGGSIKRNILGRGKKSKNSKDFHGENITISHETEKCNIDNYCPTESVIKMNKYNSDSDIDVDVETDIPLDLDRIKLVNSGSPEKVIQTIKKEPIKYERKTTPPPIIQKLSSNLSQTLLDQLKSIEIPKIEFHIKPNEISELEKFIHSEFFENRTTKTSEQYLRIRNHILTMWYAAKPNYISKTAVRSGLKQGGDVNCISRIHRLLEQIGAINFGYNGKCFEYVRPLNNYLDMFIQTPRNRSNSMPTNSSLLIAGNNTERRQRIRTNTFFVYEKNNSEQDSNYTITHIDGVTRPEPPALNSNKNISKSRSYIKHIKSELDLVKCLKFSKENIAPFKVSISLSTLLCLQLHSLSSSSEIMGFLGGHRSKTVGRNKISLTRYKPCRTSLQSGTMCEMCPISQVEQSSSLGLEGYELLGWFHSHPLFPSNPSRTDVQTQKEMQIQFSFDNNRPFVGLILSCLNMTFKCMYIMPKDLHSEFSDNGLPYEIDIDIIKDCTNFKNDIKDVLNIINDNNYDSKDELIEKFKSSSDSILKQFGFNKDIFFKDIF